MKKIRRVLSLLIVAAMLSAIAGCQKEVTSEDLMTDVAETDASAVYLDDKFCSHYSDAAFAMLNNEYKTDGPNIVISPLATFYNLSLLANGASGNTKSQMSQVVCNKVFDTDTLNTYMHSISDKMVNTDTTKFYFKNALWFNSDKNSTPSDEFLSIAKSYYDASAFKDSFSGGVLDNMNNWASNSTDMYTEHIVTEMPKEAPLYLTSIATIDADWESPISPQNVLDGKFTTSQAEEQDVRMMTSYETIYIENTEIHGFIKKYAGENYGFLALIPTNENVPISRFVQLFSDGGYYFDYVCKNIQYRTVDASIPKFSFENKSSMKKTLEDLDSEEMFSAESSGLDKIGTCDGKMYLGDLSVSTGITVTEKGTSRGTGANIGNTDIGTNVIPVSLDRPFIFAVIDAKRYIPLILGVVNSVE